MGFEKGKPRPLGAGRKKGSKNKKKIARVADLLAEREINPAERLLIELEMMDDPKDRAKIWLELLSYCQGKPKEFEPEPDDDPSDELADTPTEALLKIVRDHNEAS